MIDDRARASSLRLHSRRGWPGAVLWTALLLGAPIAAGAAALPAPRTLEFWPDGAPGAQGHSEEDRPAVTAYLPAPETTTGAGDRDPARRRLHAALRRPRRRPGRGVAARARGVAAFILRYRVVPIGTLKDALAGRPPRRAVCARPRREWGVSPQRLGAMGFSAGATLAANVALRSRPASRTATTPWTA